MWIPKRIKRQLEEAERKLDELDKQFAEKLANNSSIIAKYEQEADCAKLKMEQAKNEYNSFLQKMGSIDVYGSLEEIGYDYIQKLESQDKIEADILELEYDIGLMVKNNQAILTTREYKIDGKTSKGRQFQNNYGKNLIIGLNSVYNKYAKTNKINFADAKNAIDKAYEKYNKQAELLGINISPQYKDMLIEALRMKADLKLAKQEEKEKIKKERQRLKEQEKLLEELAKEKEKIAKERRYYEATIENCDDDKREAIKAKLAELDKRESNVEYRENNQKAGWLYVTHTKAMPNICKVGVTRRYQPLIRLQELSSASVPFPFECDGLVFSDDVFELEAHIHNRLNANRVNKENHHKEFFEINPNEVLKILMNEFGCEIIFIDKDNEYEIN